MLNILNIIFQPFELHKQNSIHLHCIAATVNLRYCSDISKPKLTAWLDIPHCNLGELRSLNLFYVSPSILHDVLLSCLHYKVLNCPVSSVGILYL